MFKLQSLSKYSPSDAIHRLKHFSYCSKQFLNLWILMPFSASAFFFPHTSSTLTKLFPLRTFFTQRHKNSCSGEIGWVGRVRCRGCTVFDQKLLNIQCSVGGWACKSPVIKWANMLKETSKNIYLCWAQPLTTTPAGTLTDTDGSLEHSPSRGSLCYKGPALQKIVLFFSVLSHISHIYTFTYYMH